MSKIIDNKKNCVGCGACELKCPQQCITMKKDGAGFMYPSIDNAKCINCGLCEKVCIALNNDVVVSKLPAKNYYASWANKDYMNKLSTSGGIIDLIAKEFCTIGYVAGATFDNNWNLKHYVSNDYNVVRNFAGSKYIQSDTTKAFSQIINLLKNKNKVLFIGTPCQVAALKKLTCNNNNLYTVDFICHGVPSPKAWKKFVQFQENKYGNLKSYNFRSKKHGWSEKIEAEEEVFENKKLNTNSVYNAYHLWFGKHLSIRESCFNCQFRMEERPSDITVSDFWGIGTYYPELSTKQGVSAVIINSDKGQYLFDKINNNCINTTKVSRNSMWENPRRVTALQNYSKPEMYDEFIKDVEELSPQNLVKKYPPLTFAKRVNRKIKFICNKIIKLCN